MTEIIYSAVELDPMILHADNHLLAVNKPAGLLTQDSGTGLRNMEDWAREWVRVDKNKSGNVFLNAVHRIDKAVSGVVLFARTSKALSRLNEDIRKRNCKKIYHALVERSPEKPADELVHWLSHEHHRAEICREGAKGAQRAVLRYRILERFRVGDWLRKQSESSSSVDSEDAIPPVDKKDALCSDALTLLEVDLETGRYHQIRAQLAVIGCPIAGDEKYGAKQLSKQKDIALHHARLEVTHPTSRDPVVIEAPYPVASEWWAGVQI